MALLAYKAALERAVQVLEKAIVDGKDISEAALQFGSSLTDRWAIIKWVLERIPEEDREKLNVPLQDLLEDLSVTIEVGVVDEEEVEAGGDEAVGGDETGSGDEAKGEDEGNNEGEPAGEDQTPGEGENSLDDGTIDRDETNTEDEIPDEDYISICSLKKLVTAKILAETVGEKAALLYTDGVFNSRQILAIYAMALQTEKTFDEVLEVFRTHKGLGSTAKALGLMPRDALKGVKAVFKAIKAEIKEEFKAARLSEKDFEDDRAEEDLGTTDDEQASLPGEAGSDEAGQDTANGLGDQDAGKDKAKGDGKNDENDKADDKDEDSDKDDKCGNDLKNKKDKAKEKTEDKGKDKAKGGKKDKGRDKDDDDDHKSLKKADKNEKARLKGNSDHAKAKAEKFMEKVKKLLESCNSKAKGKGKK